MTGKSQRHQIANVIIITFIEGSNAVVHSVDRSLGATERLHHWPPRFLALRMICIITTDNTHIRAFGAQYPNLSPKHAYM